MSSDARDRDAITPRDPSSPRDLVYLRTLRVSARIGVSDEERREPQTLHIDIAMACDASLAAAEDDIKQAVNYHAVATAVEAHCREHVYKLVETLAERLAALIRREFQVPWIRLAVGKPDILAHVREVGVVIERGTRDQPESDRRATS